MFKHLMQMFQGSGCICCKELRDERDFLRKQILQFMNRVAPNAAEDERTLDFSIPRKVKEGIRESGEERHIIGDL